MSDQRNVEDVLGELGKKIDELIAETKGASAKVSKEMDAQIQRLKEQKEKLEEQLKNRTANNDKWVEAREHLNEAASSVNKALSTLFKDL